MNCPSAERVQQFVAGELGDTIAADLESHLLACTTCSETLDGMLEKHELCEVFRSAGETENQPSGFSTVAAVIERGKRIAAAPRMATTIDSIKARLLPPIEPTDLGRLGEYRVLEVLGEGGMGVVFHAVDQRLARDVALKIMHSQIASASLPRQRFLSEAKAMASTEHDNIAAIYQVGEDNGMLYIAMQLLKGESLHSRIARSGSFDATELLRIGREISQGLAVAHKRGFVHRDIKPDNIWLQQGSGRVKILDFGLARPEAPGSRLTQAGEFLGTPQYMAPEQARGEELDARCDLFSLGVLLYQMASGSMPFTGRNSLEIAMALAEQEVRPLSEVVTELDPDFSALVMELLEKDRRHRPENSSLVVERIRAIERKVEEKPTPPTVTSSLGQPPKTGSNSGANFKRLLTAAGEVGLLLLLLGILFRVKTRDGFAYIEVQGDAEVEQVFIDQDPIEFTVDASSGKLKFAVDPGSHELSIKTPDGVELTTTLGTRPLKVSAGKDITLKAWKETTEKADPADELPFRTTGDRAQIERRIAEHLLSISGVDLRLSLRGENGQYLGTASQLDELPETSFYVYTVGLNDESPNSLTGRDLDVIGQAASLESLGVYCDLPQGLIEDDWIRFCQSPAAKSGKLQHLSLQNGEACSDRLVPYLSSLKSLITIQLSGREFTDAGLSQMELPNLRSFQLHFMPKVSMDSVDKVIQVSPGITHLALNHCDLSRSSLESLATLDLVTLSIPWAEIEDHHLRTLNDISSLKELDLSGNKITASGLRHLQSLSLEDFTCLSGTIGSVGDECCQVLSQIRTLHAVRLSSDIVTDVGIGYLAQLPNLKELTVWTCPITDESIRLLESASTLKRVNLKHNDGISKEAIQRLKTALPECEVISDYDTE